MAVKSVRHTAYFRLPVGSELTRDTAWKKFRKYLSLKERQGWRFERLENVYKTPEPVITEQGDIMDEYNFVMVLSREERVVTLDLPDAIVEALVRRGPKFRLAD